jgi:triosephosphate isomerase
MFKMVSAMVRTLIAGNWKMNGLSSALSEIQMMRDQLAELPDGADCLVCPPATLLSRVASVAGPRLRIGGQTCHREDSGAHTGDISATMLAEAGATYVIVGHSERRADHGETDLEVAAQLCAAQGAGLTPIVCVGESLPEREVGDALTVIGRQLQQSIPDIGQSGQNLVIAYEPIWAIGTGRVPTPEQIGEVHHHVRTFLTRRFPDHGAEIRILYGGSMTSKNARRILQVADVNGGLVGGASLRAEDFMAIYRTAIDPD